MARPVNWRQPAAIGVWSLLLALLIFTTLWGVEHISQRLLARDAEQSALTYAAYLADGVPGIERLLDEGIADNDTLAHLRQFTRLGDIFRFRLFGRDGRQVLLSDHLGADDPLETSAATPAEHQGSDTITAIVLGGENHVTLQDGTDKADRPDVYSEAHVPLWRDGRMLGVIGVYVDQSRRARAFNDAFLHVTITVGIALGLVAILATLQMLLRLRERQRAQHRIRYLAEHDALSGALNRSRFAEALEAAVQRIRTHDDARQGTRAGLALLCIDLDRLKDVNDTHGHQAGDDVLRAITVRLRALLRPDDEIARLGGDEFAVLLSGVVSRDTVSRIGQRVVNALAEPIDTCAGPVACGASVGAACFGSDADSIEDLLNRADLAMYRAKTLGRGQFSFYDPEADRELKLRRELGAELRAAIGNGQLELHFQPLFDGQGSVSIVGYEALLRWRHPERGMIPPSTFIPLAEETGLIVELGRFALQTACTEASGWPAHLKVAVNLSPAQLGQQSPTLAELVLGILENTGLPPARLELEITESMLMTHTEETLATLNRLADAGIRIAMDDFGTGYSSLSYLWRFPFDKVKIDQAFTRGLESDDKAMLIVRSIVSLAHSMGIRVNAEGVETEAQRRHLQSLGCDELQGFLLGRPAPTDALAHLDAGSLDRAA